MLRHNDVPRMIRGVNPTWRTATTQHVLFNPGHHHKWFITRGGGGVLLDAGDETRAAQQLEEFEKLFGALDDETKVGGAGFRVYGLGFGDTSLGKFGVKGRDRGEGLQPDRPTHSSSTFIYQNFKL